MAKQAPVLKFRKNIAAVAHNLCTSSVVQVAKETAILAGDREGDTIQSTIMISPLGPPFRCFGFWLLAFGQLQPQVSHRKENFINETNSCLP